MIQVKRDIDLVYGGGSIGLMGLVSQAVYDGGRHVLGYSLSLSLSKILRRRICFHLKFSKFCLISCGRVIPKTLMPREVRTAHLILFHIIFSNFS